MEKSVVAVKFSEETRSGWERSFTVIVPAGAKLGASRQKQRTNKAVRLARAREWSRAARRLRPWLRHPHSPAVRNRPVPNWTSARGSGMTLAGAGPPTNEPKSSGPCVPEKSPSWINDPGSETRVRYESTEKVPPTGMVTLGKRLESRMLNAPVVGLGALSDVVPVPYRYV